MKFEPIPIGFASPFGVRRDRKTSTNSIISKLISQGGVRASASLLNGSIGSCMVGGSKTNLNIESLHDVLVQI